MRGAEHATIPPIPVPKLCAAASVGSRGPATTASEGRVRRASRGSSEDDDDDDEAGQSARATNDDDFEYEYDEDGDFRFRPPPPAAATADERAS